MTGPLAAVALYTYICTLHSRLAHIWSCVFNHTLALIVSVTLYGCHSHLNRPISHCMHIEVTSREYSSTVKSCQSACYIPIERSLQIRLLYSMQSACNICVDVFMIIVHVCIILYSVMIAQP